MISGHIEQEMNDIIEWIDHIGGREAFVEIIHRQKPDVTKMSIDRHLRRTIGQGYIPSEYWLIALEMGPPQPDPSWFRLVPSASKTNGAAA